MTITSNVNFNMHFSDLKKSDRSKIHQLFLASPTNFKQALLSFLRSERASTSVEPYRIELIGEFAREIGAEQVAREVASDLATESAAPLSKLIEAGLKNHEERRELSFSKSDASKIRRKKFTPVPALAD